MQDKANAKQSEYKTKLIQDKANLGHIDESRGPLKLSLNKDKQLLNKIKQS
jgi:hypothetical protein